MIYFHYTFLYFPFTSIINHYFSVEKEVFTFNDVLVLFDIGEVF